MFVRFPQGEYKALDKWTEVHLETMTPPQAVRRLVERGLRRAG